MALITWQDMLERFKDPRSTALEYPEEAKKAFDYYYKKFFEKWGKFPREIQLKKMASVISATLSDHGGKFVPPGIGGRGRETAFTFKELVKENKKCFC
jgi:hypothetical protein